MSILNQYSYVLFAGLLILGVAVVMWRWRRGPVWLRAGLIIVVTLGVFVLGTSRRYPTSEVTTLAEADAILTNEQPTFVMLYSNYCVGCLAALPSVRDLSGQLAANNIDTLLVNIHDNTGEALVERFKFVFSPTYLVFGPNGEEVLRANALPRLDQIQLAIAFELG